MSVNEILTEVPKLSPAERKQLLEALLRSEQVAPTLGVDEPHAALHARLLAEGLLRRIPPRRAAQRDFEPVPIEGKPLSETIIEERR